MKRLHDTGCCVYRLFVEISWCDRSHTYRVRNHYVPMQLEMFEDCFGEDEVVCDDLHEVWARLKWLHRNEVPKVRRWWQRS